MKFERTTPVGFYTSIEDIKNFLKNKVPEWEVRTYTLDHRTLFHLNRWNFTKGKAQLFPYQLDMSIFAYIDLEHTPHEYFLLDVYPIREWK